MNMEGKITEQTTGSDMVHMLVVFENDVRRCFEALGNQDTPDAEAVQFWRRALARTLFGQVEGLTYRLKQMALRAAAHPWVELNPGELVLLREESYELDDRGHVKIKAARLSLSNNLRFASSIYAKAAGATYELPVSGAGWQSFKTALRLRDRLMHPKKLEEQEAVTSTVAWFNTEVGNCMSVANDAFEAKLKSLQHARKEIDA